MPKLYPPSRAETESRALACRNQLVAAHITGGWPIGAAERVVDDHLATQHLMQDFPDTHLIGVADPGVDAPRLNPRTTPANGRLSLLVCITWGSILVGLGAFWTMVYKLAFR
jgi:hypothetical protein